VNGSQGQRQRLAGRYAGLAEQCAQQHYYQNDPRWLGHGAPSTLSENGRYRDIVIHFAFGSSFAPILVPYMNNVKEMFLIQGMHWATPKVHFWPLAAVLERKGDQVRGFPVCDS